MTLEYPYTRTTGPVMGAFLTGLRDGRILANRCGNRVLCPPLEYDPDTAAPLDGAADMVEVGPGGTVQAWTWVAQPTRKHPFDHPFAFALIQLDGADTAFVHAVDAGSEDAMSTGMRVAAQYRDERHGAITDVYFVPEADAQPQDITPGEEPVTITEHLVSLEISEPLYPHRRRFAEGLVNGRILGQRSPVSGKVYVPSLCVAYTRPSFELPTIDMRVPVALELFTSVHLPSSPRRYSSLSWSNSPLAFSES